MTRIVWSRPAQNDVFDIAEYYDAIDRDLANEMIRRLEEAVAPLRDFAGLGSPIDDMPELRKWRVKGTPFVLFYRTGDERVDVARVLHAAADWRP